MQILDRSYQTEAVSSIWSYFQTHETGNPLVAMPTGTGKSIVIARFLQSIFGTYPNQKILILTHVKELIQQNYEKLMMAWPFAPAGIYSAGLNKKEHNRPITFGGIASVWKVPALFGHVDLVMIDEVHLVSPTDGTMYQAFLRGLLAINPFLRVVGFTATPWRLGHGKLIDPVVKEKKVIREVDGQQIQAMELIEEPSLFSDICFDITGIEAFNRLIAEGFLVPLTPKPTKTKLSLEGVHMRGGEFIEKELQTAVDKEELTYAALKEAMESGHDRKKWLIFASGIDHADHIAEMLTSFGVTCGSVHSKRADRDQTITDFKAGKLRAVVNNNVLTTGFDDPEIDMIVCLRPTASAVLWVQMLGRGTRPLYAPGYDLNDMGSRLAAIQAGGKLDCLVLDYAANTKRLGPINDPVVPRRKGQGAGEAPIKECPECLTYVHASLRFCNAVVGRDVATGQPRICGHEFTFESKLLQSASSAELIRGDMPIVEVFRVDHITVSQHEKLGAPPMMRVSYFCGFHKFDEYVCIEHQNFAGRKARQWWAARTSAPMPTKTVDAIELAGQIKAATHLRVWINKKYPEILATCFDGTAFGTKEADPTEIPMIATESTGHRREELLVADDEIPF